MYLLLLHLDLMLEMEFIIIQFLNPSLLMVSSILKTPPMLVYQECTSTELTRTHVRITLHRGYSTTTRAVWFILLEHEGHRPEGESNINHIVVKPIYSLQNDDITSDYHGELLTS